MPNALRVLVNLSHAVKRDSMHLSLEIGELKRLRALRRKGYYLEWHQNDSIFSPIVISQLEFSLVGKTRRKASDLTWSSKSLILDKAMRGIVGGPMTY